MIFPGTSLLCPRASLAQTFPVWRSTIGEHRRDARARVQTADVSRVTSSLNKLAAPVRWGGISLCRTHRLGHVSDVAHTEANIIGRWTGSLPGSLGVSAAPLLLARVRRRLTINKFRFLPKQPQVRACSIFGRPRLYEPHPTVGLCHHDLVASAGRNNPIAIHIVGYIAPIPATGANAAFCELRGRHFPATPLRPGNEKSGRTFPVSLALFPPHITQPRQCAAGQCTGCQPPRQPSPLKRMEQLPMAALTFTMLGAIAAVFLVSLLMILAFLVGAAERKGGQQAIASRATPERT